MFTYHRLLLLTALSSAFLTFLMLQFAATNATTTEQNAPQQMQSVPLPQATQYYAMDKSPTMMTLAWQPCVAVACATNLGNQQSQQRTEIGI